MNYNLTRVNIANASAGIGFKEAPRDQDVVVTGFGIVDRIDRETGENKKISIIATEDGTIYSGDSVVMAGRLEDILDAVSDAVSDAEGARLKIVGYFADIKCSKGSATTFVVKDFIE